MAADGSVVFTIDLDEKDAEQELSRLKKEIIKLEEQLYIKKTRQSNLEKTIETAKATLKDLKESVRPDEWAEKITPLEAQISSMEKNLSKISQDIDSTNSDINEAKDLYGAVEKATRQAANETDRARVSVAEIKQQLGIGLRGLLVAPFQLLGATVKRIPGLLKGAFSTGAKAIAAFGKGVFNAVKNLNVFTRMANAIGPTLKRLGKMVTRTFVFNVVSAGLRSLRSTISSFLEQNTALSLSLDRTKAALTTAFMPVYNAVVPALTALLNVITRVISAIAQFNATLFGTTAKQAQKNAKALTEQADATEAAGGAAKEASKQFASFDEVEKLSDTSGAGGGGGAAAELAEGFDLEFDDTKIEDWGQAFSDALDRIIEKVKQLPAVFSEAAGKINEFFKKLLDALTFPGVQEKMRELGALLADAFNGLVKEIDWYTIGAALGAALNLALGLLVSFIYTFDWIGLGKSIAELINGIVAQINWYEFGQLLWSGFKIALEFLAGLIIGMDMAKLAQAASSVVIGFFNSMKETLQKIDWEEIGHQVATFLANVKWADVADACFSAIGAAFGAATKFLWGLIKDAWAQVVQWWYDHAYEDGQFTFEGLLSGIIEKVKDIGAWIKEHIFQPFIDGFKSLFGINSPSTVMAELGGYLLDGLFNGLTNFGSKIKDFGNKLLSGVKNVLGVHSPSREFEEIGEYALAGLDNGFKNLPQLTEQFETQLKAMVEAANNSAKKTRELIDAVNKYLQRTLSNALQTTRSTTSAMATAYQSMAQRSISAIQSIISALNSIPRNVTTTHTIITQSADAFGGGSSISVSTPHLAAGAVIPPNREFLAVLGDQKHGTNIEAPLETIVQAFRAVIGEQGGSKQNIVLQIDRRELGRAVADVSKLESQRIGLKLGGAY